MKKFSILLFLISNLAQAILLPATDMSAAPTDDNFINYQWPLFNQGQSVITDADDIHPLETKSNPKVNINWMNFDSGMQRDAIVAVIDSGLDSGHSELKGKILPGFNFTVKDSNRAKLFDDDAGHGTHMSGIIAAQSNNGDGISGLSNRIKILPLKVYDSKENSREAGDAGATAPRRKPIAERVAEALEFAIDKKVDVINLSLGWPRVANTPAIEAAFKKAVDAGILIVAAAGNDHHEAQIFPCAYRNVICVGSVDIDGKLSNFSNYGGHVDMAAPGQEILSIWPTIKSSARFGPKGYELKSGTSQAAPFVTGTLAILRATFPNETAAQIRARLLMSTKPFPQEVAMGFLDLKRAFKVDTKDFLAPVFKGIEKIEVDPQTLEFTLPVIIESFQSQLPQIQITSENKDISFGSLQVQNQDAAGMTYQVRGRLRSLNTDNRLKYLIKLNGRTFEHQVLLTIPLEKLKIDRIAVPRAELVRKNELNTVSDPRNTTAVRYWSYEKLEKKLRLYVWTLQKNQFVEKSIDLDGISEPQAGFNLISEDWLMNGKTSYLFAGLIRDEKNQPAEVQFFYLDDNLNLIYKLPLKYEGVIPTFLNPKEMGFGKISAPQMGAIKVPVFWDLGIIPEKDVNPNPFAFEINSNARRLYFLEPAIVEGHWKFITRTLTTMALDKFIRESLDLDATQDIEGLGLKIQSPLEQQQGALQLLFTVGRGVNVRIHHLDILDLAKAFVWKSISTLSQTSFDLSRNVIQEAWNLSQTQLSSETSFQGIFTPMSARTLILRADQLGGQKLLLPERGEQIMGMLKSFSKGSDLVSFIETTDYLRVQGQWQNKKIDGKAPVYRSSFLPGSTFSQLFIPVIVSEQRFPGMMIDNSQFFSSFLSIYHLNDQGQLLSPVGRTLSLPKNCVTRRNPLLNEKGVSRLAFLCDEGQSIQLRLLDLN